MKDEIFVNGFHNLEFSKLKNLTISKKELPSPEFYKRLYSEIYSSKNSEMIDETFINAKVSLGQNFYEIIKDTFKNLSEIKVLSSGAGFGISEAFLAEKGINICAQEFFKSPNFWSEKVPYYSSLDSFDDNSFDLVFEASTLYCFSDDNLIQHLDELCKLIKKNGFIFIWEQESRSLSKLLIAKIKNFILKNFNLNLFKHHTLWGFLRTKNEFVEFLPSYMKLRKSFYYDQDQSCNLQLIKFSPRIFGRQIFYRRAKNQLHIFQKS